MDNKKQLVIWIVVCVVLFLLGLGFGIIYQSHNTPQAKKAAAVTNLSSKVISSITAYGKVTKIDGQNITLSNLGDTMPISILTSARIYAFVISKGAPVQNTGKFSDIKVGDNVNVVLQLLPSGQTQGVSVIILPQITK